MTRMSPLRRQVLRAGLALGVGAMYGKTRAGSGSEALDAARSSHFPFGPVVPARSIPGWQVVTNRGDSTNLAALLRGKVTALQLMFAGCSATCPIQGALFEQAQRELKETSNAQLISVTIAPLADTPAVLTGWLRNFGAEPGWLGVRPRVEDLEQIFTVLAGGGEKRPAGPDPHTGQVYITNRRAELVYRTPSMPPAQQIVAALRAVQKSDPPA
jgi:protein SCO1